ncbi:uncharacterized protein LOC128869615 [Anastrepha ludens]|uniref:uncharacterized protein LOC128869615 n=1 Tax=Anastrepha ludens TaxID=28586 RepID=UPI0023B00357|nr:uncharacterized protein LOC128869615 [Anastrepha ludens]
MFEANYKHHDQSELFKKKISTTGASNFPLCADELNQHLLRTSYIAQLWLNADQNNPSTKLPEEHGWFINEDGKYDFTWFKGDQLPSAIDDIILDDTQQQPTNLEAERQYASDEDEEQDIIIEDDEFDDECNDSDTSNIHSDNDEN